MEPRRSKRTCRIKARQDKDKTEKLNPFTPDEEVKEEEKELDMSVNFGEVLFFLKKKSPLQRSIRMDIERHPEEEEKQQDILLPQVPQQREAPNQVLIGPQLPLNQRNPEVINQMCAELFYKRIPNKEALRDFFTNQAKRYCPPKRELTMKFCKVIFKFDK